MLGNSLSYRNSSAENVKTIWLQAHFGAAPWKKFIYLFILISWFIFVSNLPSNKDKKLRIEFSFCLIFLLLAWILPISDVLQIDILSGDNFLNCIKGLGYSLSVFCNHKKFWIAFAVFCWFYCTVICEANLTLTAFLIRGYSY